MNTIQEEATAFCLSSYFPICANAPPLSSLLHNTHSVPAFANLLRSPGIDAQPGRPVRHPNLSYRPARLHLLAESIPGLHKRLQKNLLISLYRRTMFAASRYAVGCMCGGGGGHAQWAFVFKSFDNKNSISPLQSILFPCFCSALLIFMYVFLLSIFKIIT